MRKDENWKPVPKQPTPVPQRLAPRTKEPIGVVSTNYRGTYLSFNRPASELLAPIIGKDLCVFFGRKSLGLHPIEWVDEDSQGQVWRIYKNTQPVGDTPALLSIQVAGSLSGSLHKGAVFKVVYHGAEQEPMVELIPEV